MTDITQYIMSIDEISATMYIRHISLRKMAKTLGVETSRLHAMFKYKDEEHNKLLRLACTYVLSLIAIHDDLEAAGPFFTAMTINDTSNNWGPFGEVTA